MRLSPKALTLVSAILWGGSMLLIGIVHLIWSAYGGDFLQMMSSLYPGYTAARTFWSVVIGTIYGFVDGAIAGYLFAIIYDSLIGHGEAAHRSA